MFPFKKLTCIMLLLSLLIVLLLCGCSDEQDKEDDDTTGFIETTFEGRDKDLKHTTLSFYFPGVQPKDWLLVRSEIEKQTTDSVNASLDFKWLEHQTYMQAVQTISSSSDTMDAFVCAKPQKYYPDFTKMARDGQLKDITELFPRYAPSLYQNYSKQELDYAGINGRTYAVPSLIVRIECAMGWIFRIFFKKFHLIVASAIRWVQIPKHICRISEGPAAVPHIICPVVIIQTFRQDRCVVVKYVMNVFDAIAGQVIITFTLLDPIQKH